MTEPSNDDIGLLVVKFYLDEDKGKSNTATRSVSRAIQVFVSPYQILKAYILFRKRSHVRIFLW